MVRQVKSLLYIEQNDQSKTLSKITKFLSIFITRKLCSKNAERNFSTSTTTDKSRLI